MEKITYMRVDVTRKHLRMNSKWVYSLFQMNEFLILILTYNPCTFCRMYMWLIHKKTVKS